jgi:ATP-dependent RNA helicase DDX35
VEGGWTRNGKLICMTEPRQIATVQLAQRIADETEVILGKEVGYRIRFEDVYSSGLTELIVLTEGLLLRELMYDPLLTRYNVVIIDEAHERSIQTDLLLGLLKKIQRRRPELRLIVTSATIDSERLRAFFEHQPTPIVRDENSTDEATQLDECYILSVEGRSYPVEIFHSSEPLPEYRKACVDACVQIHEREKYNEQGDVLCFVAGQDDVLQITRELHDFARRLNDEQQHLKRKDERKKLIILPLYANLKFIDQMKVFEKTPPNTRKIIVATNIAETSITIPGIVYVIDCGHVRLKLFNPEFGFEVLTTLPITRSSALQRAGRAGRVRSVSEFEKMKEFQLPEMQRCDLAAAILQIKALGIHNVVRFDFPSPPPVEESSPSDRMSLHTASGGRTLSPHR